MRKLIFREDLSLMQVRELRESSADSISTLFSPHQVASCSLPRDGLTALQRCCHESSL